MEMIQAVQLQFMCILEVLRGQVVQKDLQFKRISIEPM